MNFPKDVQERCPDIIDILESNSRLKKILVIDLAQMKYNEFKQMGIQVRDDRDITDFAKFIRTGMASGLMYSKNSVADAGNSKNKRTKSSEKPKKRVSNLPSIKAKEETGRTGRMETDGKEPEIYPVVRNDSGTGNGDSGSGNVGFSDRNLMSQEEYEYLTEIG